MLRWEEATENRWEGQKCLSPGVVHDPVKFKEVCESSARLASLRASRVTSEQDLNWENASHYTACRQAYWSIFLINDWQEKAQLTAGGATPRQVVRVYMRAGWANPEEQARKQHSSMVSASAPDSRFLPWLLDDQLWCAYVAEINTFFPKLHLVMVFYHTN